MPRILALLLTCFMLLAGHESMAAGHANLDSKGFALHGYDAVEYADSHKAVEGAKKDGDYQFVADEGGAKWAFVSVANKIKFRSAPAKYIPAYGGYCAWAMVEGDEVDVDPESFKIIDGKTYLFYNGFLGNTLKKWNGKNDDQGQKAKADASWAKLTAKDSKNEK